MRKLLYSFLFFIFLHYVGFSQTQWTGATNSDWNTATNWNTGVVPDINTAVEISTASVYPVVSTSTTCASITFIGNTGVLTVNSGAVLSTGAVTVSSSNTSARDIDITGGGTLSASSVTIGLTSTTPSNNNRTTTLTSTIANFNIAGDLTLNSRRGGGVNNNAGFYLESGIVNLDGQIVTVNQNTNNTSTFNMATGAQSGTLLLGNTVPFNLSGTGSNTISLNGTNATVNYDGTNQTILSVSGGTSIPYRNLTISGSGEKTVNGATAVNGGLTTVAGNTFNMATFQLTGALTSVTNGGILRTQYTSNLPIPTGKSWGGTVRYDGATQTVSSGTYNNLALSGTGNKTFTAATTISNNLSITSIKANLGSYTHQAGSLTLGTTLYNTIGYTYGSTSAPNSTTLRDNNYFVSGTGLTGVVRITGTTCTTGYWTGNVSSDWNTASNWCGGIPTPSTNVVIPTGTPNSPNIASGTTADCNSLTINAGAFLTIANAGDATLAIKGDLTNNSSFIAGANSKVTLNGTATAAIQGSSTSTFGSLEISKDAVTKVVTNSTKAFVVTGNLIVTQGNLSISAKDNHYTVSGNLTVSNNGVLTHSVDWDTEGKQLSVGGNLSLDGNGAYSKGTAGRSHVSMYGTSATVHSGLSSFNILTLATAGTITADGPLTVNDNFWAPFGTVGTFVTGNNTIIAKGALLVSNGTVNVTGGTLTVTGGGIIVGQTGTSSGTVNFSGGATTTDSITLGDSGGTTASSITQTGGTLSVTGGVTINQPSASVTNSWNINTTTVNVSGLITFAGNNTTTSRIGKIAITTGTLNANGGITFVGSASATKVIDMSTGGGTINLKGALTTPASSSTLTAGTNSNFNYIDSNAQTVNYFSAGAYNNLYINNTSSTGATLSGAITTGTNGNVTGNLSVGNTNSSSVFTNGGFAITLANNKSFAVANTSTFNLGATSGMVTISGTGTKTFGATSTVNYRGTNQTVSAETYGNLSFNGTGTKTLNGATTALGNVTIGTGSTLDVSSSNFSLTVGGNFTTTGGTFTTRSGLVTLNGTNQSFNVPNFYNLTLSTSGTKTFATTTAVANNLIINSNVNASLGTGQTHTANTLTLGTNQVLPTTWGNTISPALRKDDTFFTATTGIIRVASSTCTNFSAVAPITSVSLNNTVQTSSGTGSYEDLTSPALTTVVKGQSYALTVTGNTLGDQNAYYSAFFDWNNDGVFAYPSEYFQIGSIKNSSGAAGGKSASVYVTIPSGTNGSTIKMRVIARVGDYNNSACALSGSGQMEDYTISIQDVCSGNLTPGQTLTSEASVCPNTPFTLSISNTIQDGASYTWQTSPNGNDPWTNAVAAPSTFFGKETFDAPNAEASVYGAAVIAGGQLVLTPAINSQYGAYVVKKTPGSNIDAFSVAFDYQIPPGGGADGFSLSYADDVEENDGGGESGSGSRLIVEFDTYDNDGDIAGQGSRIRIKYAGATLYNSSINAPSLRPTTGDTPVLLRVDAKGKLTLTVNNSIVVSGLVLPAGYLSSDKSLWRFKFAARTGGVNDKQIIDNLLINYLDITASGPTFTTSQTTKTYYRVGVSCNSSLPNYSQSVMVDITSATITAMTVTACSDAEFSATPLNGTNGTIPDETKYTWTVQSLPSGLTGGATNTVAASTITGTLTNATETVQTASYTVTPITGNCKGIPFTLTVDVNPQPTAPTPSQHNVSCGSLGSITLSNLPAGDWKVYLNNLAGARQFSRQNTEQRELTINDLPVGTYDFTVEDIASTCNSSVVTVNIIDVSSTTTWNGSGWSNGFPDASKSVIISSISTSQQPFTVDNPNVEACSLTINVPTGEPDVEIPSNVTLKITNSVTVTNNGKLVFADGSSLLQSTNASNSGDIVYKRKTDVRRYDLTYWSSPVTKAGGFKMKDLSPTTLLDKYFVFTPSGGWATDMNGESEMVAGYGYSIRGPQEFDITTAQTFEGKFVGVPNNGDVPVTGVVSDSYFLFGNPYPSAIDVDELWKGNLDVLGPLYFWTHVIPPQKAPGDNTARYSSNDYVIYTATGSINVTGVDNRQFNGFIAAGQGFFARPKTTTIYFNNGMRTGGGTNSDFFKTAKSSSIERNRIWLNIKNAEGAFKQLLIGYIQGATNAIDFNYDALSLGGNSYVDFYSVNEVNKLAIQGRALPFDNTDTVPLGYKTSLVGDFTIGIDHADGFFDKQDVYLEDKTAGKTINLRNENYTFNTVAGTFTDRFVIRYTDKTLGTGDFENLEDSVLISVKNKVISITSSKETIKDVNIFNVGAQLMYSKDKVNSSELQINNLHSSDQVLLVKVTLENGSTVSKKVVFSNLP